MNESNGYSIQVVEKIETNEKGAVVHIETQISGHDDVLSLMQFLKTGEVKKFHKAGTGYNVMVVTMNVRSQFLCWPELSDFLQNNNGRLISSTVLHESTKAHSKTTMERWFIPALTWTKHQ